MFDILTYNSLEFQKLIRYIEYNLGYQASIGVSIVYL